MVKYLIAVLLLLLVVFLFIKIEVAFEYRENTSHIRIRIGGILLKQREKKNKKSSQPQEKSKGFLQKIKSFQSFYTRSKKHLKKALRRGSKKLNIERLEFLYVGGFEDAAKTALVYGIVSGMVYDIYALLQHFIGVKETKIQILPEFNKAGVTIETEWKLSFRVWHMFHIGSALFPLLFLKKKD